MDNKLKNKIMRRVYVAWFLRNTAPLFFLLPLLGFVAFKEIAREFFVSRIIENFLATILYGQSLFSAGRFFASAFSAAGAASLVIIGASGGLFLFFFFVAAKNLKLMLSRVSI